MPVSVILRDRLSISLHLTFIKSLTLTPTSVYIEYMYLNKTSRDRPKSALYLRLKNSKKTSMSKYWWVGDPFMKKKFLEKESLTMPKKLQGWTLWGFSTSILSQNIKNWRGDPLGEKFFSGKSLTMPKKNWKGGPFGLARYGMLRGKTGKTFLVQFARPNSAIWCNIL